MSDAQALAEARAAWAEYLPRLDVNTTDHAHAVSSADADALRRFRNSDVYDELCKVTAWFLAGQPLLQKVHVLLRTIVTSASNTSVDVSSLQSLCTTTSGALSLYMSPANRTPSLTTACMVITYTREFDVAQLLTEALNALLQRSRCAVCDAAIRAVARVAAEYLQVAASCLTFLVAQPAARGDVTTAVVAIAAVHRCDYSAVLAKAAMRNDAVVLRPMAMALGQFARLPRALPSSYLDEDSKSLAADFVHRTLTKTPAVSAARMAMLRALWRVADNPESSLEVSVAVAPPLHPVLRLWEVFSAVADGTFLVNRNELSTLLPRTAKAAYLLSLRHEPRYALAYRMQVYEALGVVCTDPNMSATIEGLVTPQLAAFLEAVAWALADYTRVLEAELDAGVETTSVRAIDAILVSGMLLAHAYARLPQRDGALEARLEAANMGMSLAYVASHHYSSQYLCLKLTRDLELDMGLKERVHLICAKAAIRSTLTTHQESSEAQPAPAVMAQLAKSLVEVCHTEELRKRIVLVAFCFDAASRLALHLTALALEARGEELASCAANAVEACLIASSIDAEEAPLLLQLQLQRLVAAGCTLTRTFAKSISVVTLSALARGLIIGLCAGFKYNHERIITWLLAAERPTSAEQGCLHGHVLAAAASLLDVVDLQPDAGVYLQLIVELAKTQPVAHRAALFSGITLSGDFAAFTVVAEHPRVLRLLTLRRDHVLQARAQGRYVVPPELHVSSEEQLVMPGPFALPPKAVKLLGSMQVCASPACIGEKGVAVQAKGLKRCGGCEAMRYCSPECQRWHWLHGHQADCKAWSMVTGA